MVFALYMIVIGLVYQYRRRMLLGHFLKDVALEEYPRALTYFQPLGKRQRQIRSHIGLSQDNGLWFVIRREKWYHRLLKALGLATEVDTGDAELDRQLFFMTDSPDELARACMIPGFIDQIRHIFSNGTVSELRSVHDRLWVRCKPQDNVDDVRSTLTRRFIPALQSISDTLQKERNGAWLTADSVLSPRSIAFFLMFCHSAVLFVGISAGAPLLMEEVEILQPTKLVAYAIITAVFILALWLGAILVLLLRKSWLPLVIADFIIVGVAGFLLSTPLVMREANISLDTTTAVVRQEPLVSKLCTLKCHKTKRSGKRSRTEHSTHPLSEQDCLPQNRAATKQRLEAQDRICRANAKYDFKLTVPHWIPDEKNNYSFSARADIYDEITEGDLLGIPVHPGALGFQWIRPSEIKPISALGNTTP